MEHLLHEQECLHTWAAVLGEDLASSSVLLPTEQKVKRAMHIAVSVWVSLLVVAVVFVL